MNRSERIAGAIIFTIGALCLKNSEAGATDRPSFSNPVQCNLGENCWVQNLVDFDNGPAHSDPFCGPATYNGHKGTDIRVATIGELEAGIPIRAMADGIVLGLRNTMPDRLVENDGDVKKIKGKECGNGVFIAQSPVNSATVGGLPSGDNYLQVQAFDAVNVVVEPCTAGAAEGPV